MGKIEETIYENYKKALQNGDFDQAKMAAQLGQALKSLVEAENFKDYANLKTPTSMLLGQHFNPFPYQHDVETGLVKLDSSVIKLTASENKLFYYFTQKETRGANVNVISKDEIKSYMWGDEKVVPSAVRIAILRIRQKIEVDPSNPQVLLNFYDGGYIFLGQKVA